MARGVIAGLTTGVVVSGLGLAAASLMLPPPQPSQQPPHRAEAPVTRADPAPDAPDHAATPAPERPPAADPAPVADNGPAQAVPLPAGSEFARDSAEAPPVLGSETAVPGGAAAPPVAPPAERATAAADPVTDPPPRPETSANAPAAPAAPETPQAALETPPEAAPEMPVPPPGEAVAPDLPPVAAPPEPGQEITLMPDGGLVPASPALPGVLEPGAGSGFGDAAGTKVNRLPQIGAAAQSGPATEAAAEETAPAPEAAPMPAAEGPAIERFAAAYAEKPGKPWLTVLLRDVGPAAGGLDRETIKALGPWVTVVLDPARPGATAAAADYRAAGFEVAFLADPLPAGAEPKDVEVALAAWRAAMPEALALVEPDPPVFQGVSLLRQQVERALADEGMVYVTRPAGMGAAGAGLQSRIWRELDQRREKAPFISRTLARAAFEAGRDGAVVVMLSAWPESVAGLEDWRAGAASGLNLAPLSATVAAMAAP
ncbi:divergent polysaccharide deacetylase family protein [Rhodobacter lacus]|uniref:Divergent polysaccharide deacetylase family protein n=1 Tax=Rhodobacter lacus TaxID=1641972 RepID=A0ABW5A8B2_9RHOB